ncbi:hypothetical protein SEA_SKINNYPETE_55 [Mycobacterium phage SkinnyPete]|uniref:Uncharacterized protein n=1 Tax=Mycobacterium phage SkinnyPete TaxID=1821539 RepID=A0A142ULP9_9CAUD|nr:hypothetical protein FDG99_gp55 [Mycobacterium phage SkinnyPete]AMU78485.1 hypothetical protein SEA_SKINNYPETE_55 [Mycobacterium phage SkinnyPete]
MVPPCASFAPFRVGPPASTRPETTTHTGETMSDVAERAKALLEGVTDGPWLYIPGGSEDALVVSESEREPNAITVGGVSFHPGLHVAVDLRDGDAEFIAAARTLVPELVAEVERLREARRDEGRYLVETHNERADLLRENERLRAAIEPIRQLHQRVTVEATSCPEGCEVHEDECPNDVDFPVCRGCYDAAEEIDAYFPEFNLRAVEWPCETAKLIYTTKELGQ